MESERVRARDAHPYFLDAGASGQATTSTLRLRRRSWSGTIRQLRLLLWFGTAAVLVYELTAEPVPGVVVFCLKFGYEHICAAFWLLWRDPYKGRGLACFCLYLAYAAIRIGLISFAILLLLAVFAAVKRNVPVAAMPAMVLAFSSMLIVIALGTSGILIARITGCRVWLEQDKTVLRTRRWPPSWHGNNAVSELTIALAILWIVLIDILLLSAPTFPWARKNSPPIALLVICICVLPWIGLALAERTRACVAARSPREAWGPLSRGSNEAEGRR